MSKFPDVSEVLRGDVLLHEDDSWIRLIHEKQHLAKSISYLNPKTILELGCGTGIYAGLLNTVFPDADYLGVDANPEALVIARRRNPKLSFVQCDFRDMLPGLYDLVCAHAFLKHFSLDDWLLLFPKFLSLGRVAQFDMQTAPTTLNDGSHLFGNNLWIAQTVFEASLAAAHHKILSSEVAWSHADGRRAIIYLTERT